MNKLKIIDFDTYGNVIQLYLGDINDSEYYGDDWDDRPYEHNAGTVYKSYIKGVIEIAFPSFIWVLAAEDDWHYNGNSPFCKEDFKNMKAPCLVIVNDNDPYQMGWSYSEKMGDKLSWRIYFNDTLEEILEKAKEYHGVVINEESYNGEE